MPVQLHVQKAKQEELGTSNKMALFDYDQTTGIYIPYNGHKDDILSEDFERQDDDKDTPFQREALISLPRRNRDDEDSLDSKSKPRRRKR